ncbi:uncharacterized protein LOC114359206 [Ostrinia furnacalis]|uniref:uncharacterized protein LOC114359206 n=1 Tax=Ostrinia furnacalis TaxID=93504 RepID=UPI00103F9329|nr:uncharacterized protein LOC114359206 [Ostrinia furnacalis]
MAATTPRRSSRIPHAHTPKMSERKKGLFQGDMEPTRESLTTHRRLPVVDSESDSEDCDLGIISTLDSSSGDETEHGTPRKPNRNLWPETRSQTKRFKETQDLKNFIKSPFTLKKYQTRYSCPEKCSGSLSTPATPHFHNHPGTPSSTHSCNSVHTTSSTSSRARKSLASLIADTESCSSSLKDLNFDTDSGTDSKENTPTKSIRRSKRNQKTPQFLNFKGILMEQKKNISPMKTAVVCLTKMDMSSVLSPTQMLKTPHNTTETNQSPPKLGHNRRSVVEIQESPESTCDSEKSHKRLRNDSLSDSGPNSKYPRLDNTVPKARLSLFNSDRLKEILSAKSFYGKTNPELNPNITAKISNAIEVTTTQHRRPLSQSHSSRRKRRPGQINSGVRHKIRKPKIKNKIIIRGNTSMNTTANTTVLNNSTMSNVSTNDLTMKSQNSSQDLGIDRADPFDSEKQTIEALLSQWTEEEVPESELSYSKPRQEVPCFSSTVIEETNSIFEPVTAVPVPVQSIPQDGEAVIVELGTQNHVTLAPSAAKLAQSETSHNEVNDVVMSEPGHSANHGDMTKNGQFLPVEGGYIFVAENGGPVQEELPDLDEIERELKMLDEQILKMAESNNINPQAVIASTETLAVPAVTDRPVQAVFRKQAVCARLAEGAMAVTRAAVEAQNAERKGFMQHLRRRHAARHAAATRWARLVRDYTHDRAVFHESRSWPASWQLDPTEGPGRVRVRLRRAHLRIHKRFLQPAQQYKPDLAKRPPPLRSVLGRSATERDGLAARLQLNECVACMARVTHVTHDSETCGELLLTDR